MSKTLLNRRLPTLQNPTPAAGGSFDEETLLKGRAVRRVLAEMEIVVTVTTVGPAAYHEDAPFSYLRNWELLQEGKTVLTRINGASQRLLRRVEGNTDPSFTLPVIAVGANVIRADVTLETYPADTLEQDWFSLWTGDVGEVILRATFGDLSDIYATLPTTAVVTSAEIRITQEEYAEDFSFPPPGPLVARLIETRSTLDSASRDQNVPRNNIAPGGMLDTAMLIARDGAALVRDSDIIDRVRFIHAGATKHDIPFRTLANSNKADKKLEALPAGVAKLDFDRQRDLLGLLVTRGVADMRFDIDTNTSGGGTPEVRLVRREIFRRVGRAAQAVNRRGSRGRA